MDALLETLSLLPGPPPADHLAALLQGHARTLRQLTAELGSQPVTMPMTDASPAGPAAADFWPCDAGLPYGLAAVVARLEELEVRLRGTGRCGPARCASGSPRSTIWLPPRRVLSWSTCTTCPTFPTATSSPVLAPPPPTTLC